MFNPLSTSEVIAALGRVLKDAAASERSDEYGRSQLLSAYSVARHLAAEEAARERLDTWFRGELVARLGDDGSRLASAAPVERLAEELCELLARLRSASDPESRRRLAAIRALLRRLCDQEVAALAEASA